MPVDYTMPIIIGLIMILSCAPFLAAQEKADEYAAQQPSPEEMAAMQQRWTESGKSGKHHRWLGQLAGEWDISVRLFWGSQGPTETKGKGTISWKLEGKWLESEYEYEAMGQSIKAVSLWGYDNFKQKFVTSTIDSFGTAMYRFEGVLDRTGKVLRQWGTVDEPMTGEHDKMTETVLRLMGNDKFVLEIHDMAIDEKEDKVLEFIYTRRK